MRRTFLSQRHLAWLLGLLLLLPMAQTAAYRHMLSHLNADRVEESDSRQAAHLGQCDLCLSAAVLIGGAPLISVAQLPQVTVLHEAVFADLSGIVLPAPSLAYDSRAPPFSVL